MFVPASYFFCIGQEIGDPAIARTMSIFSIIVLNDAGKFIMDDLTDLLAFGGIDRPSAVTCQIKQENFKNILPTGLNKRFHTKALYRRFMDFTTSHSIPLGTGNEAGTRDGVCKIAR